MFANVISKKLLQTLSPIVYTGLSQLFGGGHAELRLLDENGEVIEVGTHGELMAKNGKYADMFRKQAENYIATGVNVS